MLAGCLPRKRYGAFGYGFGAVLLGATLDQRGSPRPRSVSSSRRWWRAQCSPRSRSAASVTGSAAAAATSACISPLRWSASCFSTLSPLWALILVAFSGALSTEVVESGPFTSLEQAMLASELEGHQRVRGFGIYNAVATSAGAVGALAAGIADAVHRTWTDAPANEQWFLAFRSRWFGQRRRRRFAVARRRSRTG